MSEDVVNRLRQLMGELRVSVLRKGRISVDVDVKGLKDVVQLLKGEGFTHLSAITGLEVNGGVELLYHLAKGGVLLTVKVKLPAGEAVVPSITDLIPGAALYEREVHDMLGVNFKGHPNLAPLLVPDNWPKGSYPLRKSRLSEGEEAVK